LTPARRSLPTRVTYLDMKAPPPGPLAPPPPPPGAHVVHRPRPSPESYLELYDAVGAAYTWTARKLMPRAELAALLSHPAVEVHVLEAGGETAGYAELDARVPGEVELAYFGLLPAFHGRGLGRYLLTWAIRHAWRELKPRRLWVHTCDLDAPAALKLYLSTGFNKYLEQEEEVELA